MKQVLMSIRPEHLVNCLNGEKTLELRTVIPKNYVGWVNLCCTKGKPYLYKGAHKPMHDLNRNNALNYHWVLRNKKWEIDLQNGKVIARFWFDEYEEVCISSADVLKHPVIQYNKFKDICAKVCLSEEEVKKYIFGKDYRKDFNIGYAMHIKNLEIFDKPKELREFKHWVSRTVYSGLDCPPYEDDFLMPITKAPQNFMYCEVEE